MVIIGAGLFFSQASDATAQVSAVNVLKRAAAAIEKVEADGAQVLFVQIDNLKKGQTSTQTYTLAPGHKYAAIAIGDDERIQDLDLIVLDDDDDEAGRDSDDKNVAVVQLKPRASTTYKFAVKGYKMNRDDGFFALILCRLD